MAYKYTFPFVQGNFSIERGDIAGLEVASGLVLWKDNTTTTPLAQTGYINIYRNVLYIYTDTDISGLVAAINAYIAGLVPYVPTPMTNAEIEVADLGVAMHALNYKGTWDANTNTPALASGVGSQNDYYIVSVPGNTNLDGITDWQINDWLIFNGTAWTKIDNTDLVTSVNTKTGAVVLDYSDVGAEQAFSKNTAFNKNFGTTTGTVTEGDDSRVTSSYAHISLTNNPHSVTAAQAGAVPITLITDNRVFNGFINRTDSEISFVNGTLTFTIQPKAPATEFSYYIKGTKYTKNSAQDVVITNVEGNHIIYFDGSTLTSTTGNITETILKEYCVVGFINWSVADAKALFVGDERHSADMFPGVHYYLHTTRNTAYAGGLGIGNYILGGDGSLNTHAQFSIANGTIMDEDIDYSITSGSPQTLTPIANLPVYYRSGASGLWKVKTADSFAFIQSGAAGYTGASGLIAYNQWTGATWQLTEVNNLYWINTWVFATTDINNPVFAILGQVQYTTLAAASSATISALDVGTLPVQELKLLYKLSIQTRTVFTNAVKAKYDAISDFRTNLVNINGSFTSTSHSALSNLDYATSNHTGFGQLAWITTTDPTINDDSDPLTGAARSFRIGDFWLNTSGSKAWQCMDNTVGAAVWLQLNSTATIPKLRNYISMDMADFALSTSVWTKSFSGSGAAAVLSGDGGELELGTVANSRAHARVNLDANSLTFWDRNPSIHVPSIIFEDTAFSDTYYGWFAMGGGDTDSLLLSDTDKYVAFYVDVVAGVDTFKAINCNGISKTETTIVGVDLTISHSFDIIVTSGVNVKFLVDGSVVATHTTNLPSGARDSGANSHLFNFAIDRTAGSGTDNHQMRISPCAVSYDIGV